MNFKNTDQTSSQGKSTAKTGPRTVGILGIEKRITEQHKNMHESISEVFFYLKKNYFLFPAQ